MDIKLLREVDADGLERWEPVMKQGSRSRRPRSPGCWTPSGSPAGAQPGCLHPRPAPGRAAGAERRRAGGPGPQAARPLPPWRLRRRARRPGGGQPGQHRLSARACRTARRRAAPLRGDRRRTNSVKFHVGERDAAGRWRAIVGRAELTAAVGTAGLRIASRGTRGGAGPRWRLAGCRRDALDRPVADVTGGEHPGQAGLQEQGRPGGPGRSAHSPAGRRRRSPGASRCAARRR